MRTYMMAGNWKMNKTLPEAVALLNSFVICITASGTT